MIKNPFPFEASLIDNGFWQISNTTAMALAKLRLPAPGNERKIRTSLGQEVWLAQTKHWGEVIWSVRLTSASK